MAITKLEETRHLLQVKTDRADRSERGHQDRFDGSLGELIQEFKSALIDRKFSSMCVIDVHQWRAGALLRQ